MEAENEAFPLSLRILQPERHPKVHVTMIEFERFPPLFTQLGYNPPSDLFIAS
jgi:hypothetical protein